MSLNFTHSTLPCFLDFEASSLTQDSYPVQVAWSDGAGHLECWLIRPAPEWTDWCDQAEEMHGISQHLIEERGCDITWLCQRMNRALAGKVVFTDGVHLDRFWLRRLFVAGSFMPRFRLGDVYQLLEPRLPAPEYRLPDLLPGLMAQARRDTPGFAHQADSDVRYLLNLWRLVRKHHPAVSQPDPARRVLTRVPANSPGAHTPPAESAPGTPALQRHDPSQE
ncbi:hypothetical protein [Ectothiorhodospira marina]|jgi:hypothetical protein|uniref:Uncharacterized protein n=1 Tax=Ectothiorhodospira marina TaxID=1396821 RepID=A0A1H7FFB5_9GAMM|nr:hypothetical protein [Ectothiorhodospira marina]SEK23112.1 hypothetical protein SAMN05444515_101174 [Ectothiorhodospira marina]